MWHCTGVIWLLYTMTVFIPLDIFIYWEASFRLCMPQCQGRICEFLCDGVRGYVGLPVLHLFLLRPTQIQAEKTTQRQIGGAVTVGHSEDQTVDQVL